MAETIRVGVVGFGLGGRIFHAPFVQAVEGLELGAILARRHAEEAAKEYPSVAVVGNMRDLLARNDLSLIVITTPPSTHFELALQALEAGKHVVIDKPFTPTSVQALQLMAIARSRKLLLSAFQNRRWDGDFLTLKKLIEDNALGRLVSLESRFERYQPGLRPKEWQEKNLPGNGLVHDLGAHLADQALVLFGTPQTVTGDIRYDRDRTTVNDGFAIHLEYPRLRVSLYASLLAAEAGPRFVAHGTLASYVKYGLDPQEPALKAGAKLGSPGWGEEPESAWGKLTTMEEGKPQERAIRTLAGDYRGYYENVRDAIPGKTTLAVPASEGRRVVRLLELAIESSERRKSLPCISLDNF